MLTQREFVRNCYDFYKEAYLTPGNPDDGVWQKAHYPKPKKMGRRWVWLLEEHHAIQAVLQSEEVGRPCVWSWERKHFVGEWAYLLPLFEKWLAVKNSNAGKASVDKFTPEELSARGKHAATFPKSPPKPDHKIGLTPASDKQKKVAKETFLALHSAVFKCLVTDYVSDTTSLTRFQLNRGIDPSLRVELPAEEAEKFFPKDPEEAKKMRRLRRLQRKRIDDNQ